MIFRLADLRTACFLIAGNYYTSDAERTSRRAEVSRSFGGATGERLFYFRAARLGRAFEEWYL
jgi:hypothetical protein